MFWVADLFGVGEKPLDGSSVHASSSSNVSIIPDTNTVLTASLADRDEDKSSSGEPHPLGMLGRLPPELRILVWQELLVSKDIVYRAHTIISLERDIMVNTHLPQNDIDSSVLRTCRKIYHEALPILYGNNNFEFHNVDQIRNFQYGWYSWAEFAASAGRSPLTTFAFESGLHGRLGCLRSVNLCLNASGGHINRTNPRQSLWQLWGDWIEPKQKENEMVAFPALEELTLDFDEWMLTADGNGKLRVSL